MQGGKVWNSIEYGWTHPIKTDAQGLATQELKPRPEWGRLDSEASEANAKALFCIFNGVVPEEFKRIANCKIAKEAWDILEVTHEGPSAVKISKLQMLTSKFETIRMNEDQYFSTFYSELSNIVNSSFNLGEPIPDSKVVRKILRSLPERFRPKVTAIEESKNIDSMRVDELVGSIQTYEMTLPTSLKPRETVFKAIEKKEKES